MRLLLCACALALAAPAMAQEAETEQARAVAEFKAIALKKTGPREQAARNAEVADWTQRHATTDLGSYGFLRPLAKYFGRDYAGAGDGLLEWLDAHPTLPTADYDIMVGRILLSRSIRAARNAAWPVFDKALPQALARYTPPSTLYRYVGMALAAKKTDGEAKKRLAALIGKLMVDSRVSIDDRLDTAAGLLAPRSGGAKRPSRPKPVFKPFTATDMDGVQRATADYRGTVLLIDFWATWCGPCLREMPNVVAAYKKYHDQGFEVLGVSLDKADAAAKIREVTGRMGMPWPQIYDGKWWKAALAVKSNVRSIPATFLLGRDGKLRYTNARGAAFLTAVEKLIKEPAPGDAR